MVTTAERKQLREELVSNGYSWDYIDSWQPKITLYRHTPGLNENGKVCFPVGTAIPTLPSDTFYRVKKSRIGWLPYPPTDSCECKWCVERAGGAEVIKAVKDIADGWEEKQEDGASVVAIDCQECEYKAEALTQPGALSKLRIHAKIHEGTGTV